jgi:hypothetical protein
MDAVSRSDLMLGLSVEAEQLRQALQDRPSVDVAKGILMGLYGYDEQGAFTALHRVSQHHGVGLSDLAVALVEVVCAADTGDYEVSPAAVVGQHREPLVQRMSSAEALICRVVEYVNATAAYGARVALLPRWPSRSVGLRFGPISL